MKRLSWFLISLAVLASVTGCSKGDSNQTRSAGPAAAVSAAASTPKAQGPFSDKTKVDGVTIGLTVEPFKIGENHFVVTLSDPKYTAVEFQVIMQSMGHGAILDMTPAGAGKFEVTSGAIDMDGKWMLRVRASTADGETVKQATFYTDVKPENPS